MPRFEVVELRAKVRDTGYGVQDSEKGWICEMFMFAEIGVARAEREAKAYAESHNPA
jgi:hypothetical protein